MAEEEIVMMGEGGPAGVRLETGTIGMPHLGSGRELKTALESYFHGSTDAQQLLHTAQQVEEEAWRVQREAGIQHIGVGDFALYDWTLDWIDYLGCAPHRFRASSSGANPNPPIGWLERYFLMARGREALRMRKWFDNNYMYQVPEVEGIVEPTEPNYQRLLESLKRAKAQLGDRAVPMLLGPVTFVWLAHVRPRRGPQQEQLFQQAVDAITPTYKRILTEIGSLGFGEVQVHEPALVTEDGTSLMPALHKAYGRLLGQEGVPGVDLVTYFDELEVEVLRGVLSLPLKALSLDFTHAGYPAMLEDTGFPSSMRLGLGALDGRSVWKPDPSLVLPDVYLMKRTVANVRLQPSCSLQFLPWSLASESSPALRALTAPPPSFALEKLADLKDLAEATGGEETRLEEAWGWTRLLKDPSVEQRTGLRARVRELQPQDFTRSLPYSERQDRQALRKGGSSHSKHKGAQPLLLPTTLVGGLPTPQPQPQEAAQAGGSDPVEWWVRCQEEAGLDFLIAGSFDKTDMVEAMASKLEGMVTTQHGWVRVYGSRCVRPPLVVGDLWRPSPLSVHHFKHAQALTQRVVKAQLCGPLTLLNWSFPAQDRSLREQALQLALCLRDEVRDLEIAGAKIIEVDEPGFREGLPLRGQKRRDYLTFFSEAFRLATSIAGPHIEIHTHVCYTEVESCLSTLLDMDADAYYLENTRSQDEPLLSVSSLGPGVGLSGRMMGLGVLDTHTAAVPSADDIEARIRLQMQALPETPLMVVPDAGMRTRTPDEAKAMLRHMVEAAGRVRAEVLARQQAALSVAVGAALWVDIASPGLGPGPSPSPRTGPPALTLRSPAMSPR